MNSRVYTRGEIDRRVNIWIDGMLSLSNDAGWRGDGPIAMFMTYGKWVGTGFDKSNESMIKAIEMLRKEHAEFVSSDVVIRELARDSINSFLAVTSKNYLNGLNHQTTRAWTDRDRAKTIGISYRRYLHYLEMGYKFLKNELERLDRYRSAI